VGKLITGFELFVSAIVAGEAGDGAPVDLAFSCYEALRARSWRSCCETRAARERLVARFNGDLDALVKYLRSCTAAAESPSTTTRKAS